MPKSPARPIGTETIRRQELRQWRISGKNYFLTYPQCELTPADYFNSLTENQRKDLQFISINQEDHEPTDEDATGGKHLHVLLQYTIRRWFKNVQCFDVDTYHGNYQVCREPSKVLLYCRKNNGPRHEHGEFVTASETGKSAGAWSQIRQRSGTREEFLAAVRELSYRDWVLSNVRIIEYADREYGGERRLCTLGDTSQRFERLPLELSEWSKKNLNVSFSKVLQVRPTSRLTFYYFFKEDNYPTTPKPSPLWAQQIRENILGVFARTTQPPLGVRELQGTP